MKLRLSSFFFCLCALLCTLKSEATYFLGLSAYSPALFSRTSSDSAKKDLYTQFQFPLSFAYEFKLNMDSRILPQLNFTLFPKKSSDGGSEESHLILEIPYLRRFTWGVGDGLEWKAGLVLHQERINGKGGTIDLNNGGSTSTFYLPSSSRTIYTFEPEIGLVYQTDRLLMQGDLLIEAPINNKRRGYALILGIAYAFGGNTF